MKCNRRSSRSISAVCSTSEYSALKALTEAEERLRQAGLQVWLVGLGPEVLAVVQRSPLGAVLGPQRLIFNLEIAVATYRGLLEQPASHVG